MVAYNGYTASAKKGVSKSNHNTVVKKLNLLIQECHLSPNGKVKLKMSIYDKKEYEKGCWYDVNTFRFFTDYFPTHLNNDIEWKNNHTKEPWGRNGVAGGSSNSWGCTQDKYIGYVTVVYTNSNKKIQVLVNVPLDKLDLSKYVEGYNKYENNFELFLRNQIVSKLCFIMLYRNSLALKS
mgnify:CR=1 FL=1